MPRKNSTQVANHNAKVRAVLVGALEFETIGPHHWFWANDDAGERLAGEGTFVRVIPPPEATDQQIAGLKKLLEECKVKAIDIKPRPRVQVVVGQATPDKFKSLGIRETVEAMTKEANSKNPAALEVVVQETLVAVKL